MAHLADCLFAKVQVDLICKRGREYNDVLSHLLENNDSLSLDLSPGDGFVNICEIRSCSHEVLEPLWMTQ